MFRAYEEEGIVIIVPDGELDVTNSTQFKEKVLNEYISSGKSRIIFDMSNVGYMDSSGLGAIISILKNARMNGGGVVVANLEDSIKRLFSITSLDKIVPIYSSVNEALEKLK
ncbi:MAG: STAS domain-containing protein [Thermotogaceae bacterium]|nr:STAS domain-containing protein [Thermotogaceae bacterium]